MVRLTRYWFTFEAPEYSILGLGCGVTAYSYEDALLLMRQELSWLGPLPPIRDVIEDVDVTAVDPGHVRPNMDPPNWRGVWFPPGGVKPSR